MDAPENDFQWFGEGFQGFPKKLPEDCIEYTLYIIDSKLKTSADIRAVLKDVQRTATDFTRELLKDYIWQRESFSLEIQTVDQLPFLRGQTNYGDSIEDEWLIVYLLRELSRRFTKLWIKVVDADGEFLLVEAANALPRWLNPEIADNRVWLHNGKLLIIPLQHAPAGRDRTAPITRSLSLQEAHTFISANPSKIIHSPTIEDEAFYRLRNYPKQITENLQHSLITIPRKLAYILKKRPSSISPAVEAFYLRDPIAMQPLQAQDIKALSFPPADFVTMSVKFSKVGYAQLKSQQFSVPPAWSGKLPKNSIPKEVQQAEMGMKVSCGFEMLVADPQNKDKKAVREIQLLLDDIESGEDTLPTDETIASWDMRQDDESWLDINFEDFERELAGKKGGSANTSAGNFGDKTAQEDLRKMVERFEQFLNDDKAGAEGAEDLDDMDYDDDDDDDDDDDSEISSEGEDKDVSFNEQEFARMMREMMGMPPEEDPNANAIKPSSNGKAASRVGELDSDDEEGEGEEIRKVMQRMEAELNEADALNLDPTPRKIAATKGGVKGKLKGVESPDMNGLVEKSDDEDVDIDFNLAKNLLESFKGQAGMAGPGGNLMGMLGMQLPRDEDDGKEVG
ncbi:MAG: hypothetical protein M1836_000496 [Candelina mexicana]|nr:MAG: hypothetical protein M1836_000496 [Candelina mexicana]